MQAFDTLRHYARLYVLIEARYIQARMQYRADFVLSSIGMAFVNFMGIFVFWVIFNAIPSLAGWNFNEMVFIYAFYLIAISPMQLLFDNLWQLRYKVQEGSFIKYYFKPLNMMFYYMSEIFDLKGLTQLGLGIAGLIYASVKLQLVWTLPKLGLLLVVLFSASLVIIAMMVIAASAAFWITNSFGAMWLAFRMREFSPYPITIFDGVVRSAFTFVIPIAFIAFYPVQLILRPEDATLLTYSASFVGFLAFAVAYRVWTVGVNHCRYSCSMSIVSSLAILHIR